MITGLKNKKQSYLLDLRAEEKKENADMKLIKILENKINGINKKLREVRK